MATFVCPGSFDPITNGHYDIILRALVHCDNLIVAVGDNKAKKSFFTLEEKIMLLNKVFMDYKSIKIESFTGLTEEFARSKNATALVRGLRALSDFEFEFQMALLNRKLNPNLETLFIMTNADYSYISSAAVRELLLNNGDITGMVPDCIKNDIISLCEEKRIGNR